MKRKKAKIVEVKPDYVHDTDDFLSQAQSEDGRNESARLGNVALLI